MIHLEMENGKPKVTVIKNPHAQALGSLGGKSTSEAKKKAVRENGKKGGRPSQLEKAIEEIKFMIDNCYNDDGEMSHKEEQGTYQDGLLDALQVLKKK